MKPTFHRIGRAHEDAFFDEGFGCNGRNAGISIGPLYVNVGVAGNIIQLRWRNRLDYLSFGKWFIEATLWDMDERHCHNLTLGTWPGKRR